MAIHSDHATLLHAVQEVAASVFGDRMTATHVGAGFTCEEAELIADMLRAAGCENEARTWLRDHAEGDDEIEDMHHGWDEVPEDVTDIDAIAAYLKEKGA